MVEDLHLGYDASRVDDEIAQELELGGGQVDLDAGARDFVRVLVDDQVADAQEGIISSEPMVRRRMARMRAMTSSRPKGLVT